MFRNRLLALLLAVCCIAGLSCGAAAAEVDCDSVYCFSAEDFSGESPIAGICITLPTFLSGRLVMQMPAMGLSPETSSAEKQ